MNAIRSNQTINHIRKGTSIGKRHKQISIIIRIMTYRKYGPSRKVTH